VYIITAWSIGFLEKLIGSQLLKKFLAFYGTLKLIVLLMMGAESTRNM
jgi:hypothetical protein